MRKLVELYRQSMSQDYSIYYFRLIDIVTQQYELSGSLIYLHSYTT